jgi:serine/threonine-protein kinase
MPLEKLGPYQLEKLLGRGGMGAVYVGRHESTGDRAAVKLLSGHLAEDPTFRERFRLEIETLKRLLHPNIVQLHGFGEEEGHLYYVMELVEGRSLQDELLAGRRFDWREVTRIGIAIAHALKHAHDRGIIHRDLKPANLLIDAQDHIKLADFGIAKLYGGANVTAEGGMLGTADYMAPEQASGKPVSSRCDLYSLGSVLYALVTGKPPFAADTMVEVIAALQNETPVSVRRLAPDTPEELDNLILQLLEKDPQKRIPTTLALANRLQAMEHALSLETRVMGPSEPIPAADDVPIHLAPRKTEPIDYSSRPTTPLAPNDAGEYHFADDATVSNHTRASGDPAGRTALSTQIGKKTGAIHGSDHGTHAVPRTAQTSSATTVPPEKISQFTSVTDEDLRGPRESDDAPHKQWALAAALAITGLMIVGISIYFATRPPSAERLYAQVKASADRGDAADLLPVEADLNRFLQLYPTDVRAAEIKNYQAQLERYRLERRLKPSPLRSRANQPLTPIERAYQDALRLADNDPEAALQRLDAFLAVYDGSADSEPTEDANRTTAQCLELARQQIARLRPDVEKLIADERASLERQLVRADQLAEINRPAAEQIWRGIIILYRDKLWASDFIKAAETKLDEKAQNANLH